MTNPVRVGSELKSFVGRVDEMVEAQRMLARWRMVTVTGTGGIGKTHLLTNVIEANRPAFDGIATVDLTRFRTADSALHRAIGNAVGMPGSPETRTEEALIEYCAETFSADRQFLLALDNCEHLAETIARLLQRILKAAPGLRVLATSRTALQVQGERLLALQPLELAQSIELFLDRAAAISTRWADLWSAHRDVGIPLPEHEQTAVEQVCRMLEGLPLSIELAARRLRVLSIHDLVDRLPDRLKLLTGGSVADQEHHRSLRALLDWSRDLLSDDARMLWGTLSVFAGTFDLEGAEAVATSRGIDRDDVLPLVSELVDQSLLVMIEPTPGQTQPERTRYRMLETILSYGKELQGGDHERDELRLAHADHTSEIVRTGAENWLSKDELRWMFRLLDEDPNINLALGFFRSRPELRLRGLRLAVDAARTKYQMFRGGIDQARLRLEEALASCADNVTQLHVDAMALNVFYGLLQARPEARPLLRKAEELARSLGVEKDSPWLLFALGIEAWLYEQDDSRAEAAIAHFLAAERIWRLRGASCTPDAHLALLFGATLAGFVADQTVALELAQRVYDEASNAGARWSTAWGLWCLALAEMPTDPLAALAKLQTALRMQQEIEDPWGSLWTLWLRAVLAAQMGHARVAAQLFGSAESQGEQTKVSITSLTRFRLTQKRVEDDARHAITDEAFDQAWEAGRQLTFEQTLALALKEADAAETDARIAASTSTRRRYPPGELTPREYEIAELVAAGLSNPKIAATLVLSPRTVESHVKNIVGKLKLLNRVDVARWVGAQARHDETTGSDTSATTSVHSITNGARSREPEGGTQRRDRPGRSAS